MSVGSSVVWMEGSLWRAKRQVAQCESVFSIPKWDNKLRIIPLVTFVRGYWDGIRGSVAIPVWKQTAFKMRER